MQFIVDVPDVMPANFASPSLELLRFIRQIQELCLHLAMQFRMADDRGLFTAFIRNGIRSVFKTYDFGTAFMYSERICEGGEGEVEDGEILGHDTERAESVFMEPDQMGRWVVLRMSTWGWCGGNVTLYSSDFEEKEADGTQTKAEKVFGEVARYLAANAHRVPGANH